jgi:predicted lipoprotein with Yx(FWY)xxD motif
VSVLRRLAFAAAVGASEIVASSCGGGGSSSSPTTIAAGPLTLRLGTAGTGAAVLVDGTGRTLYVDLDERANPEACNKVCLQAWPPVTATPSSPPVTQSGVSASLIGNMARGNGTSAVTYSGYPLHYYAGDGLPGEANGEGVQKSWYTITGSGRPTNSGG